MVGNFWSHSSIEAVLDISQYVLADKGMKIESYGQIPGKLFEAKIIDKDFLEKMRKMIGFRNRAIHNYPSLDEKQLYDILQKDVKDFKEFLRVTNSYLEKL